MLENIPPTKGALRIMTTCLQSSNSGWGQICQQEDPSPAECG